MAEQMARQTERERLAHDLVWAHALELEGEVWLVPQVAHFERSAPTGASLERCPTTGELRCVDRTDHTRSGRTRGAAQGLASLDSGNTEYEGREGSATISSGWRSNAELLLMEGRAQEQLESERVVFDAELLEAKATTAFGWSDEIRQAQLEIIEGLSRFGYLQGEAGQAATETEQLPAAIEAERVRGGFGGCVFAGGYCEDSLGRVLQALAVSDDELRQFSINGCVINIGEAVTLSTEHERRVGVLLRDVCAEVIRSCATTIEQDRQILDGGLIVLARGAGEVLVDAGGKPALANESEWLHATRLLQAVRARLCRKECLKSAHDRAAAFVERPTAMATLRRPWKAHIRTSG